MQQKNNTQWLANKHWNIDQSSRFVIRESVIMNINSMELIWEHVFERLKVGASEQAVLLSHYSKVTKNNPPQKYLKW